MFSLLFYVLDKAIYDWKKFKKSIKISKYSNTKIIAIIFDSTYKYLYNSFYWIIDIN